jgi:dolichol-phosphate mannosyltransferase
LEQAAKEELVTVVVPAYKEPEHILGTLSGIVEVFRSARKRFEVLVVIDRVPGDETSDQASAAAKRYNEIRIVEREGRRGVGDAICTGIRQAAGDIVIIVMGDESEDPRDIVNVAGKAARYDIVFTSRFGDGRPQGYPPVKYLFNRICNLSTKLIFRLGCSDMTNAFKAYRRGTLSDLKLKSKGFEIFLELPLKAIRRAHRATEVKVLHTIVKNKTAKFSVTRDGYKYVLVIFSLLVNQ